LIIKIKEIHGDKYDYNNIEYSKSSEKIKLFCKKHKYNFYITPNNLISKKQGCPYCSGKNVLNKEDFLKHSIKIHKNKYDYTEIQYVNQHTKVKLYCKKHKYYFYITPQNHLNRKHGCPKCGFDNIKYSQEEYINKCKDIYGDKYDFSNTIYNGSNKKIKIYCKLHQEYFETDATRFINKKQECPYCSGSRINTKIFIDKSIIIHGDNYDYCNVLYKNSHTKVKIYCKEHNKFFEQTPNNHLQGKGCPLCATKNRRLKLITRIQTNKLNGYQLIPFFNQNACKFFDDISIKENIHIQHAMNGGEFYIKELGYWLDGYDKENNIAYEFDEEQHFIDGDLIEKDKIRQQEIEHFLKCKFIRFSVNF